MKAREFLAQKGEDFVVRDLIKEPLTAGEIHALAERIGDVRELVKPINRAETAALSDDELVVYLAENPNSVRRPIIDTGGVITLGFTPAVRAQLVGGEEKPARPPRKRK